MVYDAVNIGGNMVGWEAILFWGWSVFLLIFVCVHCVSVCERQSVGLFVRKLPFDSVFGLLSASLHYCFALHESNIDSCQLTETILILGVFLHTECSLLMPIIGRVAAGSFLHLIGCS